MTYSVNYSTFILLIPVLYSMEVLPKLGGHMFFHVAVMSSHFSIEGIILNFITKNDSLNRIK